MHYRIDYLLKLANEKLCKQQRFVMKDNTEHPLCETDI